jgi:alkaline phosphatase D
MKKTILFTSLIALVSFVFAGNQPVTPHAITLNPNLKPFYHGVASGDPLPDGVMLWTRVTPDTGTAGPIKVYWQIATDVNFNNVVNYGKTEALEANDYCVKLDVCGLQPSTFYYYMFNANGKNSIIARTKTAPASNADNDSARFAVVSCASWEHGYFNSYENISARNDVDAVLHLGDYIYEYASGDFTGNIAGRTYDPTGEAYDSISYHFRHSQYKLDDQLRRIHQLFPFITVWDDHETCNDAYRDGGQNHQPATEGPYNVRKKNSTSTYFKWMPLRKPDPLDTIRIFRKLRYGKLLDLIMLDTRLYDRDVQDAALSNDPNHHMMGPVQRAWYFQQLADTTTRWKIIGNQVMFAPMKLFGQAVNKDQWDTYEYERNLIINQVLTNNYKNMVLLTGDIHTSWCNDVPGPNYNDQTGAGSVCVEFVGPSVTSLNFPIPVGQGIIKSANKHEKYVNLDDHGYYLIDVKKGKVQADYKFNTVEQLHSADTDGPSYFVNNNERFLRLGTKVVAPAITAANPPLLPDPSITITKIQNQIYVNVDEDELRNVVVIPNLSACPALGVTVIDNANHGISGIFHPGQVTYQSAHNYSGKDTIVAVVCQTSAPFACDTVTIFVTVRSVIKTDTITVNIDAKQTKSDCFSFDDITTINSITNTTPLHGVISFSNDTCLTFTADSNYRGFDVIRIVGCETATSICDTIIYVFKINHPTQLQTIYIDTVKNKIVGDCFGFDDLFGAHTVPTKAILPKNGNVTWLSDSCFKLAPFLNFVGKDSILVIACDNNVNPPVCDSVLYIVTFREPLPNKIEEPQNLVVLSVYPNPASNHLYVQYYLQKSEKVSLKLFDVTGKLVTSNHFTADAGLRISELNLANLTSGTYLMEMQVGDEKFSKRIARE